MGLEAIAVIALISYFIFLKDNQMPVFNVDITRTGYSFKTIPVEASSAKEATHAAIDMAGGLEFSERTSEYEAGAVTDADGNVVKEDAKEIPNVWFAITGRIPGDDEDSTFVYLIPENTRRAALFDLFDEEIYQEQIDAEEVRKTNVNEHGQSVFINNIVCSMTEIRHYTG